VDFTEARDSEWQWHQLGHMHVCNSLQTDNHASTPPLSFLQARCPSCHPTNSVKALKAFYRPDAMFSAICNYFPWKCTRTVIAPADKSPARSPPSYQACWSALHNVTSANHVLHTAIELVFMTATGLSSSDQNTTEHSAHLTETEHRETVTKN